MGYERYGLRGVRLYLKAFGVRESADKKKIGLVTSKWVRPSSPKCASTGDFLPVQDLGHL